MKIAFHGAARTVTGSKHLITLDSGTEILLDCGMFQGLGPETDPLNRDFGFDPAKVSCLVLSHAHIDHSGLIPKLVKEGFKGKIYCTPATRDLALVLLEDSANIQSHDEHNHGHHHHFHNELHGGKEETRSEPYYDIKDVAATVPLFEVVNYNEKRRIADGVELMMTDAGHIIGSCVVNLTVTEGRETKQIMFSGDVGRYRDVLLCPPATFPQSDIILIESTYGDSLHEELFSVADHFLEIIKRACVEKGGKLIIPAFSVGRTQELLYYLNQLSNEKLLPDIPVIVDSPLSRTATQVVKRFRGYFNEPTKKLMESDNDPFDFPNLRFTETVEDSIAIKNIEGPAVIMAASGMADAGRIRYHIRDHVEDPSATILLVGYCSPHSLGGRLMAGDRQVFVAGREHEVRCTVESMQSMSAHGDYEALLRFLSCQDASKVEQVFLVHGEYEVQQAFAKRVEAKGFATVRIPERHEVRGI